MMSKEKAEAYLAMLEQQRVLAWDDKGLVSELSGAIKAVSHIINPKGEWVHNEYGELIRQ